MESTLISSKELVRSKRWDFDYFSPEFKSVMQKIKQSGWQVKYLKDIIIDLTDGQHGYLKHVPKGIPLLRTTNLFEDDIRLNHVRYIAPEVHANIKRSQLKSGDVLLATIGVTLGTAAVFDGNIGEANINQNLVKITLKPEINSLYLSLFLNSRLGRLQTKANASKSVIPIISYSRLNNLLVPVPPRSLQDQIAQVMQVAYSDRQKRLEESQDESRKTEEILSKYLQINKPEICLEKRFLKKINDIRLRMDVHHHMPHFTKMLNALKCSKYKLAKLGDIASEIVNGATPRAKGDSYILDADQGVPFIRVTDISNYSINLDHVLFVKKEIHEKSLKKSQIKPGDVLLSMAGTIGLAAVVPDSMLEANINQAIASIRVEPHIKPRYLEIFLNSWMGRLQATRLSRPVVQANINLAEIKEILVPIPPKDIQEIIVIEVEAVRDEINRLKIEAEAVVATAKARVEQMILGEEEIGEN